MDIGFTPFAGTFLTYLYFLLVYFFFLYSTYLCIYLRLEWLIDLSTYQPMSFMFVLFSSFLIELLRYFFLLTVLSCYLHTSPITCLLTHLSRIVIPKYTKYLMAIWLRNPLITYILPYLLKYFPITYVNTYQLIHYNEITLPNIFNYLITSLLIYLHFYLYLHTCLQYNW